MKNEDESRADKGVKKRNKRNRRKKRSQMRPGRKYRK